MATPEILDFERLLRPISDDQPAGVELKEDSATRGIYQAVKDAREAARTNEKKLSQARLLDDVDMSSVEKPDWGKVFELSTQVIEQHSKDLWVASWMIEALARLHGFAGLRDGFRLTRELAERFWDDIHPRPDEDGYSTTVAQLTGLNGDESEGALIGPIFRIPITAAGSQRALSSADYTEAIELDKMTDTDRRAARIDKGAISLEVFEKAARETPASFYQTLLEDIEQAIDEFYRLGEALETRCGKTPDGYPAAPPVSAIRSALTDVRDRVKSLAGPTTEEGDGENAEGGEANGGEMATGGGGSKKGMSREQAFRQLLQVADFFRRTEPHSPVSYALEQAVRWGKMSLPELLAELVSDSGVRDDLYKRLGIPQPEESDE